MSRKPNPQPTCRHAESAAAFFPKRITLNTLRRAAGECRGCALHCDATQTVFGEGATNAAVLFVGEQPGNEEDLSGKPFVGPSGKMLDQMLEAAGIARHEIYITNAVKHFKFTLRGKRRIHSRPNAREVRACRPWLEAEIAVIRPQIIVCLGSTAAQALLGTVFRLTRHRHELMETPWAPRLLATNHPSALLRAPDESARRQARKAFLHDMKLVRNYLETVQSRRRPRSSQKQLQRALSLTPGKGGEAK